MKFVRFESKASSSIFIVRFDSQTLGDGAPHVYLKLHSLGVCVVCGQAKIAGTYEPPVGKQRMCVGCTTLPAPFGCEFTMCLDCCNESYPSLPCERHMRS